MDTIISTIQLATTATLAMLVAIPIGWQIERWTEQFASRFEQRAAIKSERFSNGLWTLY
jgi:hypothetical protein